MDIEPNNQTSIKTLRDVAARIAATCQSLPDARSELHFALSEFTDWFRFHESADAIAEEPALTGFPEIDAFLAGWADQFCLSCGRGRPQWVHGACRFLPAPSFLGGHPNPWQFVGAPIAFKIRNVFPDASVMDIRKNAKKWFAK
jgi:hypothetical protein